MSRIGKMPIDVPSGVEVKVEGTLATVTGPRGTLSQTIPTQISVRQEGSQVLVERPDDAPPPSPGGRRRRRRATDLTPVAGLGLGITMLWFSLLVLIPLLAVLVQASEAGGRPTGRRSPARRRRRRCASP